MNRHVTDFDLLQFVAGELALKKRDPRMLHLVTCASCGTTQAQLNRIDGELRDLAAEGQFAEAGDEAPLSADDPFLHRPRRRSHARAVARHGAAAREVLASLEKALPLQRRIRRAAQENTVGSMLAMVSPDRIQDRLALLYALQECGRQIAEGPAAAMEFAKATTRWLRTRPTLAKKSQTAERVVPRLALGGQAHLLAAQACLWMKEFARTRRHLHAAYRSFGSLGDDTSMAIVEVNESVRRSLSHEGGATPLAIARRARATFDARGLEDMAARALVAEGYALAINLDRNEEAIELYRRALPIFERYELWSNYVGAVNSIGTSLNRLGRFEEARREYARALRRFTPEAHRAWSGYLRAGLAETLFAAGRFREAAAAFVSSAKVFSETGLRPNALLAALLEVESWARHGETARARLRLESFLSEVQGGPALDKSFIQELSAAVAATSLDLDKLAALRHRFAALLQQRA